MNKVQSKNHKIGAIESSKRSLSCFGGEIYILDNGIGKLAFGA